MYEVNLVMTSVMASTGVLSSEPSTVVRMDMPSSNSRISKFGRIARRMVRADESDRNGLYGDCSGGLNVEGLYKKMI